LASPVRPRRPDSGAPVLLAKPAREAPQFRGKPTALNWSKSVVAQMCRFSTKRVDALPSKHS